MSEKMMRLSLYRSSIPFHSCCPVSRSAQEFAEHLRLHIGCLDLNERTIQPGFAYRYCIVKRIDHQPLLQGRL
jgi:hypothetical protein